LRRRLELGRPTFQAVRSGVSVKAEDVLMRVKVVGATHASARPDPHRKRVTA